MIKRFGVALLLSFASTSCGSTEAVDCGSTEVVEQPGLDYSGPVKVKQLAAGFPDFYGRLADGTVVRWSFDGIQNTAPALVSGLAGVVDISGKTSTHCAVLDTGRVMCWGRGEYGQLGDGVASAEHYCDKPVEVMGLTDAVDVAVSERDAYVCAARKSGSVVCWGLNDEGTLGFDSPQCGPYPRQISDTEFVDDYHPCESKPRDVPGVAGAVSVAVGTGYQCARDDEGSATCWGSLGSAGLPLPFAGLAATQQVSVTDDHACALLEDTSVACWGDNIFGQLGPDESSGVELSPIPMAVPGLDNVASLTATGGVTCAPRIDGRITCWGEVGYIISPDDLGISGYTSPPIDLPQIDDAVDLVLRDMNCFRRKDDSVRCWPNWGLPLTLVDVTWSP